MAKKRVRISKPGVANKRNDMALFIARSGMEQDQMMQEAAGAQRNSQMLQQQQMMQQQQQMQTMMQELIPAITAQLKKGEDPQKLASMVLQQVQDPNIAVALFAKISGNEDASKQLIQSVMGQQSPAEGMQQEAMGMVDDNTNLEVNQDEYRSGETQGEIEQGMGMAMNGGELLGQPTYEPDFAGIPPMMKEGGMTKNKFIKNVLDKVKKYNEGGQERGLPVDPSDDETNSRQRLSQDFINNISNTSNAGWWKEQARNYFDKSDGLPEARRGRRFVKNNPFVEKYEYEKNRGPLFGMRGMDEKETITFKDMDPSMLAKFAGSAGGRGLRGMFGGREPRILSTPGMQYYNPLGAYYPMGAGTNVVTDPTTVNKDNIPTADEVKEGSKDLAKTEQEVAKIEQGQNKEVINKGTDASGVTDATAITDDMSFSEAFRAARNAGLNVFTWKGKQYGTELGTKTKKEKTSKNTTEETTEGTIADEFDYQQEFSDYSYINDLLTGSEFVSKEDKTNFDKLLLSGKSFEELIEDPNFSGIWDEIDNPTERRQYEAYRSYLKDGYVGGRPDRAKKKPTQAELDAFSKKMLDDPYVFNYGQKGYGKGAPNRSSGGGMDAMDKDIMTLPLMLNPGGAAVSSLAVSSIPKIGTKAFEQFAFKNPSFAKAVKELGYEKAIAMVKQLGNSVKGLPGVEGAQYALPFQRGGFADEESGLTKFIYGGDEDAMYKEGGFPDLNNDGKLSYADILKGRGVFQDGGEELDEYQRRGSVFGTRAIQAVPYNRALTGRTGTGATSDMYTMDAEGNKQYLSPQEIQAMTSGSMLKRKTDEKIKNALFARNRKKGDPRKINRTIWEYETGASPSPTTTEDKKEVAVANDPKSTTQGASRQYQNNPGTSTMYAPKTEEEAARIEEAQENFKFYDPNDQGYISPVSTVDPSTADVMDDPSFQTVDGFDLQGVKRVNIQPKQGETYGDYYRRQGYSPEEIKEMLGSRSDDSVMSGEYLTYVKDVQTPYLKGIEERLLKTPSTGSSPKYFTSKSNDYIPGDIDPAFQASTDVYEDLVLNDPYMSSSYAQDDVLNYDPSPYGLTMNDDGNLLDKDGNIVVDRGIEGAYDSDFEEFGDPDNVEAGFQRGGGLDSFVYGGSSDVGYMSDFDIERFRRAGGEIEFI